MDRVYQVCGDCAAKFLALGAVRSEKPEHAEIGLGVLCETHPKGPAPQATSAFEGTPETVDKLFPKEGQGVPLPFPPEGAEAHLVGGGDDRATTPGGLPSGWESAGAGHVFVGADEKYPAEVGPLTAIATSIFAAMIQKDGAALAADELSAEIAVTAARAVLRETRGK